MSVTCNYALDSSVAGSHIETEIKLIDCDVISILSVLAIQTFLGHCNSFFS